MNILLYLKDKDFLSTRSQELLNICSFWRKKKLGKLYVAIYQNSMLKKEVENWDIEKIFFLEDKINKDFFDISELLEIIINKNQIDIVAMGNNISEREIAPYLAAKLDWNYIPNIIGFDLQEKEIIWKRFLYGTRAIEESKSSYSSIVVTISANIYKKDERVKNKKIDSEIIKIVYNNILPYVIKTRENKKIQKNSLEQAKTVIGVGKGIGSKENFKMIEELADLMGATIGVTRAVVDHGWRPEYEKIGQTGKIIKPELYLGFGISGAMQHLAGVQQARHIIMVNNNPNAEVFRSCDLGIVADLFEVIPLLIKFLKKN
ncbi:electron transfer flavoprotein subunit alpha/FixB family protein [Fusobacterium simiae]|uniref:Electron transfer flavoprotein subunit alpha/FixB family protein n=1 Tax=Fusobacterium simiae TaxID=855 RepID=A0ABT4DJL7_FUSSI|nr:MULTISPECIES: electron transfer flavoprotein subunit alpha/FixB family protein [Fusobacterium]MCY7008797.1 electron transfer flavoprotein subunit alpha/FixB family protein [Fusobacterium simiae]MDC7956335.1 electron transfer flavoprotein subunit alpha/FixB family protein [Fusobacterium simiae]